MHDGGDRSLHISYALTSPAAVTTMITHESLMGVAKAGFAQGNLSCQTPVTSSLMAGPASTLFFSAKLVGCAGLRGSTATREGGQRTCGGAARGCGGGAPGWDSGAGAGDSGCGAGGAASTTAALACGLHRSMSVCKPFFALRDMCMLLATGLCTQRRFSELSILCDPRR